MNRGPIVLTIDEVEYLLDQLVVPSPHRITRSLYFRSLHPTRTMTSCSRSSVDA
ncbi:hypothetical protein BJV74DRAFT_830215 [Russula compacta]|nr:hypothetical protein BJV74DRAFT_830215 [Russula compacta]